MYPALHWTGQVLSTGNIDPGLQKVLAAGPKMMPDGKLPRWTLTGGSGKVHEVYVKFYKTRADDAGNEGFPVLSRRLSEKTRHLINNPKK